jgi:hypothetical protein
MVVLIGAMSLGLCSGYLYNRLRQYLNFNSVALSALGTDGNAAPIIVASGPGVAGAQGVAVVCVVGKVGGKPLTAGLVQLAREGRVAGVWTSVGQPRGLDANGKACVKNQVSAPTRYHWTYRARPIDTPVTSNPVSVSLAARR